jgi:hypothetical protein
MDAKSSVPFSASSAEASLIRGGPFYRAQQKARLIRPNQWNLARRITFLIVVGWLPLPLITAILNPAGLVSLMRDFRVHTRMLVGVPVLLLGELLMESNFRTVFKHIRQAGLLEAADLKRMDGVIATLIRARDSFLPELAILVLLIVHSATSFKGVVDATPWLSHDSGADLHLTAAGWYAAVVSASIWQFLLGVGLWKWLLWTFFAFELSRRDLKLVATHPDGQGGLGFLGFTTAAFAPIAFAVATVIASTWRHEILHDGARLANFKLPGMALIAIIALVALGPLIFFVPRLAALRRRGILEYGILEQVHGTKFHEKWIVHRAGHEAELLEAPESIALFASGQTFDRVQQLKPFPADRGSLVALSLAVVVPALPLIFTQVPLAFVLKILLKALR